MQRNFLLTDLPCGCAVQDAKQGVRNLLSRHSLLAELQAKGVLNIIPQVPQRFLESLLRSQAVIACTLQLHCRGVSSVSSCDSWL